MRRIYVLIAIASIGFVFMACKKKPNETDPPISFDTDVDVVNISFTDRFNYAVRLTSPMPLFGIKVGATAKEEVSGQIVEQEFPLYSNNVQTSLYVKNLPRQKWVIVTIKACSFRDSLNCSTKSFKVVYK